MAITTCVVTVLGGLYVLRGTVQWVNRNCELPQAVLLAVFEGEPDTFEYCED